MAARIILVAAMDSLNGVGKLGTIPWSCHEDLIRFRSLTLGGAVCYGRNTWRSLPKLDGGRRYLRDRYNILLTRGVSTVDPRAFSPNGSIAKSVEEALSLTEAQGLGPLFVIGGGLAWAEALQMAECGVPALAYLTSVRGDYDCDVQFPKHFMETWNLIQDGPEQFSCLPGQAIHKIRIFSKNL